VSFRLIIIIRAKFVMRVKGILAIVAIIAAVGLVGAANMWPVLQSSKAPVCQEFIPGGVTTQLLIGKRQQVQ
jgi:hypothetical protein